MNSIIESYMSNIEIFSYTKKQYVKLIENILSTEGITVHGVDGRVKDRTSLEGKLVRKNNKYNNIDEITDIVGVRIITYTEKIIDDIKEVLFKEFEIIEIIDKREGEIDKFGYKSLHIILKLNSMRNDLLEFKKIKDIKIEIQIRTILQHAWAEIEHDIGYKGTDNLPRNITRSFARIASLLELADIEFEKILSAVKIHEEEVINKVNENNDIDLIVLANLVKTNNIIIKLDKYINENLGNDDTDWVKGDWNTTIERLKDIGIDSEQKLVEAIQVNEKDIKDFSIKWIKRIDIENPISSSSFLGISLFYLIYVLMAKTMNEEDIDNHLEKFGFDVKGSISQKILESYNKNK